MVIIPILALLALVGVGLGKARAASTREETEKDVQTEDARVRALEAVALQKRQAEQASWTPADYAKRVLGYLAVYARWKLQVPGAPAPSPEGVKMAAQFAIRAGMPKYAKSILTDSGPPSDEMWTGTNVSVKDYTQRFFKTIVPKFEAEKKATMIASAKAAIKPASASNVRGWEHELNGEDWSHL